VCTGVDGSVSERYVPIDTFRPTLCERRKRFLDKETSAKKWNGVAGQFNDLRVPIWEEDLFLKTIEKLPVWGKDTEVLDLGCGAGRYSIAVADRCGHVTGSDVSPKMIDYADKKKTEFGKENITFVNECWHDIDINERGYKKKFDLIFGHMTPAFDTVEDIEKATRASKGYCALATFAERRAPVGERFLEFMETETHWHDENKIPMFFEYLYKAKKHPQVNYYRRDDTQEFDETGASTFLRDRYVLDTASEADEQVEEKIREFVMSEMKDGKFVNVVNAVIVTLVWQAEDNADGFEGYKR